MLYRKNVDRGFEKYLRGFSEGFIGLSGKPLDKRVDSGRKSLADLLIYPGKRSHFRHRDRVNQQIIFRADNR
jgi:hypothetical protein